MKQTVRLNENQLKQVIRECLEEVMQDYIDNMPRFKNKEEYNVWLQQQNKSYKDAFYNGATDDELDNMPYGKFRNMQRDRRSNASNLDGKNEYQPVSNAGLTFQDAKYRKQRGQTTLSNQNRNFIQNNTQAMPNGGKKWGSSINESKIDKILRNRIKAQFV